MTCPSDGTLHTYVDEALPEPESKAVEDHLLSCPACGTRSRAIQAGAEYVRGRLDALLPNESENGSDPVKAYARYRERYGDRVGEAPRLNRIFGSWKRPLWGAVAAGSVLVLLLSFAPGRSWAQKVLAMLRVQKIAVVPVDLSALTSPGGRSGREKLIAQLISDNVVVTMKPGNPAIASSTEAASEMAGYKLRTLDALGSERQISVSDEGAFHMTLDRDRIQAVLDQAGRSDIQIPASVDGSTVAVHIPKLVRLLYGACQLAEGQAATGPSMPDTTGQNCTDFVQVPSPTVSVPPGLNIEALAEAGLQLTGMSAADAHAFCETVDWSSTLVIPVPQNGGSYRTIPVDGVNGSLVEIPPHGNFVGSYALIWVKNGMVYSLGGKGSPGRAISVAESLN